MEVFTARAFGAAEPHFAEELRSKCEAIWRNGHQQCEVVSLTGRPCLNALPSVTSISQKNVNPYFALSDFKDCPFRKSVCIILDLSVRWQALWERKGRRDRILSISSMQTSNSIAQILKKHLKGFQESHVPLQFQKTFQLKTRALVRSILI